MRLSLDTALLVLALANTLVDPVDALPTRGPKRHLLRRATDGFHKAALRHSAGLAQDLRIALRGLSPAGLSVTNSSGSAAYCIPRPKSQTNSTTTSSGHSSTAAATSTGKGPSSATSASSPSSTAQSNWRIAQDYVRLN